MQIVLYELRNIVYIDEKTTLYFLNQHYAYRISANGVFSEPEDLNGLWAYKD